MSSVSEMDELMNALELGDRVCLQYDLSLRYDSVYGIQQDFISTFEGRIT